MSDPIWYLGPDWDLRALVCPEPGIDVSPERYGGIFQGLSGARSMDFTGTRMRYDLTIQWLDPTEFVWLETLYTRVIPGPFRLLDPFKKNRLTAGASTARFSGEASQGVTLSQGVGSMVYDWPSAAGSFGATAGKWTNRSGTNVYARFDHGNRTVVFPGETITASVYLKASVGLNTNLIIDWYDKNQVQLAGTVTSSVAVTTSWNRRSVTTVVPAGACTARFVLQPLTTSPDVLFTAAQFEQGSSATSWEIGGGGPRVLFDTMGVTTPRFPYKHTQISLLEA